MLPIEDCNVGIVIISTHCTWGGLHVEGLSSAHNRYFRNQRPAATAKVQHRTAAYPHMASSTAATSVLLCA